jgi:ABC-type antimicrobial peptide transport system permease subunit
LGFTLFVVAVSLALASSETRDERDVLDVVGASPKTLRRTSARKAVLLTVLGALLAVPVGFLPVLVFVQANSHNDVDLIFPWRVVTILLVAIPLIAGLVTTCGSAVSLRARPIKASTMALD